ncbi:MAG: hypothetical protein ACOCVF_02665 [bacterium]
MKVKLFEDFNEDEINKSLDDFNKNKDISIEYMSNKSRQIEGNIVDQFYDELGDKKFVAFIRESNDKFISIKYDPILFNLIYPANDIKYCYYYQYFLIDDINIFTSSPEKDMKEFNKLSLEKQVHYLTFNGSGFKKQIRKK